MNLRSILLACLAAARGTVATIGQICQNVPGCEPDPDHDPLERRRLGPASPPKTLPQPLNRRNLRIQPFADRVKHVPHDMRYYFRAASTPTATPSAAARTTVVDECRARPTTDGGVEATGAGTYFEATADAVGG